jgi:hypothetical protein
MLRRSVGGSVVVVALALASSAHAKPAAHKKPVAHRADNMPRGFAWPPTPTMTAAAQTCEQALDAAQLARVQTKAAGHMVDAIAIEPAPTKHRFVIGGITYVGVFGAGPYPMDCQLAAALVDFGDTLHDLGVSEVHFGSIYRWSKVRVGGKTKDMLSRHALGLAMDVVSFVDADGHEAVVATDYKHGNELLHSIESAVNHSGHFRTVLTPANDPISHHDHFHIEADVDYRKPTS